MWWWGVALASPEAAYGFSAAGGTLVWDSVGAAHGCVEGDAGAGDGVVGGGLSLEGGRVRFPADPGDAVTVALYVRGDDDGVIVSFGDLELAVEGGRYVLSGTPLATGPSADAWSHVAVGVGGGIGFLFVEQVEAGSALVSEASDELVVGAFPDGSDPWEGRIDELAVVRAAPLDAQLGTLLSGFGGPTEVADCGDFDGDGLDDAVEIGLGTDPEAYDTDGDTFSDGLEVGDPADPPDTDGDGLIDALDDDDDGDGIPSVVERTGDADGDRNPDLDPDGDGVENGTDPDSDGDGRSDAAEGTVDSDGDGIPDYLDAVTDLPEETTPPTSTTGPAVKEGEGCGCVSASGEGSLGALVVGLGAWFTRRDRARSPRA